MATEYKLPTGWSLQASAQAKAAREAKDLYAIHPWLKENMPPTEMVGEDAIEWVGRMRRVLNHKQLQKLLVVVEPRDY